MNSYLRLIRLNRPTGIYLLALPCLLGFFLAMKVVIFFGKGAVAEGLAAPSFGISSLFGAKPLLIHGLDLIFNQNSFDFFGFALSLSDLKIPALFILGAFVMRSAGVVVNDIFDRDFDKKVARTKNRPLASGEIKLPQAFLILSALLFVGLLVLLQFNQKVIYAGIFVLLLAFLYPLMKRVTFMPQIFLGLAYNFGVIIAGLQIQGFIGMQVALLYFACIIWTVIYDTIYAFQDIEDDKKIGVKSSAILFSGNPRLALTFLLFIMGVALTLVGFFSFLSIYYYVCLAIGLALEYLMIAHCNYKNPKDCMGKFRLNALFGAILLLGILLG